MQTRRLIHATDGRFFDPATGAEIRLQRSRLYTLIAEDDAYDAPGDSSIDGFQEPATADGTPTRFRPQREQVEGFIANGWRWLRLARAGTVLHWPGLPSMCLPPIKLKLREGLFLINRHPGWESLAADFTLSAELAPCATTAEAATPRLPLPPRFTAPTPQRALQRVLWAECAYWPCPTDDYVFHHLRPLTFNNGQTLADYCREILAYGTGALPLFPDYAPPELRPDYSQPR